MDRRTRRRCSFGSAAGTLAIGLSLGSAAAAEDRAPGDVAGLKRAFFDVDMAYWQGTIGDPRSTTRALVETKSVGLVGYRRIPFGLGMAFAPSERWIVGGRVDAAVEPDRAPGASPLTIRGSIGPFAEVMMLRDRHVRPFALIRASLGRSHGFARRDADATVEDRDTISLYPSVGVGLGSHVFLNDQLSFDAMLVVDYRWNFVRSRSPAVQAQTDGGAQTVQPEGWRFRGTTLGTALSFGLSHWF